MKPVLFEDVLQQQHDGDKHKLKHDWWAAHGIEVVRCRFNGKHEVPVDFGDYYRDGANIVVDTKASIHELMSNLGSDYRRLDHECRRAFEAGYRIVFLVECGGKFADPSTLRKVVSVYCATRCTLFRKRECDPADENGDCRARGRRRKPFQGYQLMGRMKSLHMKYGAEFEFVEPEESARRICNLLGIDHEEII